MNFRNLLPTAAAALALFSAGCAYSQDETYIAAAAEEAAVQEVAEVVQVEPAANAPAMWQIADEDTTIYLFGTVHLLPDDVEWYTGDVKAALDGSDTLVTELNLTPETEAEVAQFIGQNGMLPQGQTLRGLMSDEQKAAFEGGLAKINVPPETFDQMEPWFASIVMAQILAQASGFTPEKGVETVLETKIGEDTKRAALETVESQLGGLDSMPIDAQLDFLLEGIEDPIEGIEMLNTLVELWSDGKVVELADLLDDAFETNPLLAERLLYNRNSAWAGWIEDRLDTPGTVFIAAGALHFAGEKSVQDYLAQRGIETERLQ
ncbi:MAG: TraB/GumN family protein [Pseudomonadota bacterium]